MKDSTNILVIRYSAIGDVVLSIPAFRALRTSFPNARISLIVNPICQEIVAECPFLDEVIIYDKQGMHKGLLPYLRFVGGVRKRKFDLVIDLQNNLRSSLISYLTGAKKRIGYARGCRGFLYTAKPEMPDDKDGPFEYLNRLLKAAGAEPVDERLEFWISPENEESAGRLLVDNGIGKGDSVVGIHPGAGKRWLTKRWPKESFTRLIDELIERFKAKVVLVGGDEEIDLGREIIKLTHNQPIDAIGKTSLQQLASILKRCRLFIGSDSGPMHIATAVGTPVIAFFGPTDPKRHPPCGIHNIIINKKLSCSPCYRTECRKHDCMREIEVEEVLEGVEKIWQLQNQ